MDDKKRFLFDNPFITYQVLSKHQTAGQCDCGACSAKVTTQYDMPLPNQAKLYQSNPVLVKQSINSKYSAIFSPFADNFAVLHSEALNCLQHFSSARPLNSLLARHGFHKNQSEPIVQSTLRRMVQLQLLVPETYTTPPLIEIHDMLGAWLHVTARCNLRCAYCYLPYHKADMSFETGRAAVNAAFRSASAHNYRQVKLKYSGGEPLLRFSFIKELHHYASGVAEQSGLPLHGTVLSNGALLTAEMVREMLALGLRLMISLDNVPSDNAQRMYPDGSDAAHDVMQAIEKALECGLLPEISITVSNRNIEQLPELLTWVLERDLPFNLNFYRENPYSVLKHSLYQEEERFITGMLAAYQVIESHLPERSLLASLVDLANFSAPHLRRCSVGHSYLVVDCHGNISTCQMQMDRPVTDIYADDPLAAVRADDSGIQNVTVDEKEGCQECQWRYWCAGGCPLETFRATGRYDLKSPNCNIYKALYPEALRLEGLRLLKYVDHF